MRILITTRGSAGHLLPLAPFGHACLRAGHEVRVAAQRQHRGNVKRTGLTFAPVADPPPDEWMPLMAEFAELSLQRANERMIGEFFARIDTVAALPGLRAIVEDWGPDIIIRETCEFGSTLVAEMYDVPLVRVGLGLAAMEETAIQLAAGALDQLRADMGLAADWAGDRLRDTPYFTMVPEPLEDPGIAMPALTRRFSLGAPTATEELTDWWPGNDDPLVYLTFGSVTAGGHLPYYPDLYRAAIDELAPLRARLLVTIGDDRDVRELGPLAPNVHVERWVPHDAVAAQAAVIVGHGGYGTTLGSIRHGVPQVVMPLFSNDQWATAAAVARAGAGIALDAERESRQVLRLPGAGTLGALGPAVRRILGDASYRDAAARLASASAELPPVDAAVDALVAISRQGAPLRQH